MRYTEGFKKNTVRRLMRPEGESVLKISKETGISAQTLYNWLSRYKENLEMADYNKTPDEWTLIEKQQALIEAASMSPEEKGEWLRHKGLKSAHLLVWQKDIEKALHGVNSPASRAEQKEARKELKELHKELRRKEKALAEMSALVVLKKKLVNILEEEEP